MRRSAYLIITVGVLLLVLGIIFYPRLRLSVRPIHRDPRSIPSLPAPGTTPVEGIYFSERDRIADRIITAINRTERSLLVAMYELSHPDISAAIQAAHQRGVQVRVVTDEHKVRSSSSEIPYLRSKGVAVRLSRGYSGRSSSRMHNKFIVFDGKLAELGSFNSTLGADTKDFETVVFVSDPAIVSRLADEFERLWAQAHE